MVTRRQIKARLTFRLAAQAEAANVKHDSVIGIHPPSFLIIIHFRTFDNNDLSKFLQEYSSFASLVVFILNVGLDQKKNKNSVSYLEKSCYFSS